MTGIPKPQEEHATIMAQFACQIVHEFDIAVEDLRECLGEDTATLRLRVGCHSGPGTYDIGSVVAATFGWGYSPFSFRLCLPVCVRPQSRQECCAGTKDDSR